MGLKEYPAITEDIAAPICMAISACSPYTKMSLKYNLHYKDEMLPIND
jgi:hypothetical protein